MVVKSKRGRVSKAARQRARSRRITNAIEPVLPLPEALARAIQACSDARDAIGNVPMFDHEEIARASIIDLFDLSIRDVDRAMFRLSHLRSIIRDQYPIKLRQ